MAEINITGHAPKYTSERVSNAPITAADTEMRSAALLFHLKKFIFPTNNMIESDMISLTASSNAINTDTTRYIYHFFMKFSLPFVIARKANNIIAIGIFILRSHSVSIADIFSGMIVIIALLNSRYNVAKRNVVYTM